MNLSSEQNTAPVETASSSRHAYLGWILASALAFIWHIFWGVWLSPVVPISKANLSEAPWASYMPTPKTESKGASWVTDGLSLWSPAIFSLPSAMGFSRAALTNRMGARPPLQVPGSASVFLDQPIRAEPEAGFRFAKDLDESVREALTNLSERFPESFVFGSDVTTGTVLHVELSSGLNEKRLRTMDVPSDDVLLKDKPWEVTAFIEFNEEGKVSSVFLETKSTFKDVDAALIRSLWRWQMENAKDPLSGRVMFRSTGRPPTSGPSQGTGTL
jgi:hypothetical protein